MDLPWICYRRSHRRFPVLTVFQWLLHLGKASRGHKMVSPRVEDATQPALDED